VTEAEDDDDGQGDVAGRGQGGKAQRSVDLRPAFEGRMLDVRDDEVTRVPAAGQEDGVAVEDRNDDCCAAPRMQGSELRPGKDTSDRSRRTTPEKHPVGREGLPAVVDVLARRAVDTLGLAGSLEA
jgi:hypothetical protein